jgi:hypothetical protein
MGFNKLCQWCTNLRLYWLVMVFMGFSNQHYKNMGNFFTTQNWI